MLLHMRTFAKPQLGIQPTLFARYILNPLNGLMLVSVVCQAKPLSGLGMSRMKCVVGLPN